MNAVDFVQKITTELCGNPTHVEYHKDDQGYVIDVQATGSISSIIGKDGRTIDAIRLIANALGYEGSHRLRVRLNEQRKSTD